MKDSKTRLAYIYSFPFWIYSDMNSKSIYTGKHKDGRIIKVYPFFRQGEANRIPMPNIDIKKVPFDSNTPKNLIFNYPPDVAIYPVLDQKKSGNASVMQVYQKQFPKDTNPIPCDSLRIDIIGDDRIRPDSFLYEFLDQIKWRTNQWWINRSTANLIGFLRGVLEIKPNGTPSNNIIASQSIFTTSHAETFVTSRIRRDALESALIEESIPIYDLLLLDAKYYFHANDLRLCILNLAMSCEQAISIIAESIWYRTNKIKFKIKKFFPGNNLCNHIDRDSKTYFNQSFKDEYPLDFEKIELLWLIRNNIAHGKDPSIVKNNIKTTLDKDSLKEILKSVETLILWLTSKLDN